MNYFIAINNVRDTWDYEEWKAQGYRDPYWRFDRDDAAEASSGDFVLLYITSSVRRLQGIHLLASITSLETGEVGRDFWRPGAYPPEIIHYANLEIMHAREMGGHMKIAEILRIDPNFSMTMRASQGRSTRKLAEKIGREISSSPVSR